MTALEFEFVTVCMEQRQMLVRLAAVILRNSNTAEDVVQEALFKAWCHLATFRGEAQIDTWLVSVVVNQCKMQMRSSRCLRETSLEVAWHLPVDTPNPEQLHLAREVRALVNREIGRAPGVFRNTLLTDLMIFANNQTFVGTHTGVSLTFGSLATRRRRARIWFRERMQQYRDSHAI